MRARRTDAPRKTAITMAVMAPGPSVPSSSSRGWESVASSWNVKGCSVALWNSSLVVTSLVESPEIVSWLSLDAKAGSATVFD